MTVMLSLHEGIVIALELPQRAVQEVVETEPVVKGQTAWAQVRSGPLHCVRPYDLLTGWTVGSLKLYSLFADADYFVHCKQTLRLHVTNTI